MKITDRALTALVLSTVLACGTTAPGSSESVDAGAPDLVDAGGLATTDAASSDADSAVAPDGAVDFGSTEECVTACKPSPGSGYGGFELYGYDVCQACPECAALGPCDTNTSPPAGSACLSCLQTKLKSIPTHCTSSDCTNFVDCLSACPLE